MTRVEIAALETMFESFDWRSAFYDPLHDSIEASTAEEKMDLARMERLLQQLEQLYHSGESGKQRAQTLIEKYWKGNPMEAYEMKKQEHPITDEAMTAIHSALSEGRHWIACNERKYLLEKEDIHLF